MYNIFVSVDVSWWKVIRKFYNPFAIYQQQFHKLHNSLFSNLLIKEKQTFHVYKETWALNTF